MKTTLTSPSKAPDPARFEQIARVIPLFLSTDDVRVLQQLTIEALKTRPVPTGKDLVNHIAQNFAHVFPAVMSDPRAEGPVERLIAAYDRNRPPYEAGYPATQALETGPDAEEPGVDFPWGAAALGAAAAAIAAYAICETAAHYCGDVHPPKGSSAPTHC